MELILIRHAITQGNLERRFVGTQDVPIIQVGRELAMRVAPTLPTVEHIYRSPLIRCHQTAELLWPLVEMTVIPALRETNFGPFEGKNAEELKDDPLFQAWVSTANFSALPVGESPEDCARRSGEGLRAVAADGAARGFTRVGVVTHGGTLMGMLSQFGRPKREYYGWMCHNCGGYRMELRQNPLELELLETYEGEKLL